MGTRSGEDLAESTWPPIAQPAEAPDLKSAQSGFESQWGDSAYYTYTLVKHWVFGTLDAKIGWVCPLLPTLRRFVSDSSRVADLLVEGPRDDEVPTPNPNGNGR